MFQIKMKQNEVLHRYFVSVIQKITPLKKAGYQPKPTACKKLY